MMEIDGTMEHEKKKNGTSWHFRAPDFQTTRNVWFFLEDLLALE